MKHCPNCGNPIEERNDKSYVEWFILALFMPYLGIILYFWWSRNNKKAARRSLDGVLGFIGFMLFAFIVLLIYVGALWAVS